MLKLFVVPEHTRALPTDGAIKSTILKIDLLTTGTGKVPFKKTKNNLPINSKEKQLRSIPYFYCNIIY